MENETVSYEKQNEKKIKPKPKQNKEGQQQQTKAIIAFREFDINGINQIPCHS